VPRGCTCSRSSDAVAQLDASARRHPSARRRSQNLPFVTPREVMRTNAKSSPISRPSMRAERQIHRLPVGHASESSHDATDFAAFGDIPPAASHSPT
jgi:hypothetical protein